MSEASAVASRESDKEARQSDAEFVRLWLDALDIAGKEEKDWRAKASESVSLYRGNGADGKSRRDRAFNILYSNIETTIPAIYNSVPVPDVRRRFSDDDPVSKEVSDIIERGISYSVDSYDFDSVMRAAVQDMELPGRGVSRIRWKPYLDETGEQKVYEEVTCEHVQWSNFRHGPGRMWDDVPWIAFELFLGRDELIKLSPERGGNVNLDCAIDGVSDKGDGQNVKEVFKRARVWEIWDKESRKVIFIAEGMTSEPILVEDDPLQLASFFPIPRPLYGVETTDTLTPIAPYEMYKDQAEELERVSERIIALTSALKARGAYDGRLEEIGRISDADDNELVAIQNAINYAEKGGIEAAIFWFPIETIATVLKQLYVQRDQTKQAIYEITGIADILRGSTSPSETLGAQKIKAEWGSLRIQRKQMEVQRFARDIFRLKAELIASKFDWPTITQMTGLKYPSEQEKAFLQEQAQQQGQEGQQAPQLPPKVEAMLKKPSMEAVDQVLRNDTMRGFRIDVESDSTIRADMTRNQQMMTQFLSGTAEFMQAVGPAVVQGFFPPDTAVEVFTAFARNFRLGKQAEDALDRLADQARKQKEQPAKPDPKIEAEKLKADTEQKKIGMEMQAKQAENDMKLQLMQAEMQIKQQELALKEQEIQLKEREMIMAIQIKEREAEINARALETKAAMQERSASLQAEALEHRHSIGMEAMSAKRQERDTEMEDAD